ncbi:MAG TPA: UdgX family uracil-DNA binding protein [Gemmatimonadales bacterium]|nr:UdgX family uracil-DNA binding protein [Gemmatimonadales bacterium]
MAAYPGAEPFLPDRLSLSAMRVAVRSCRGCPLYKPATQAVFGDGMKRASIMLVGEQPGNEEDLAGKPFVGPAGRVLRSALDRAGIPLAEIYITNVVKHFKFLTKGWRRWHKKPDDREVEACRPWVLAELSVVRPAVLVCLGATSTKALLGPDVRVTRDRGKDIPSTHAPHALATVHPSAILRMPTEADRKSGVEALVRDLRLAARLGT